MEFSYVGNVQQHTSLLAPQLALSRILGFILSDGTINKDEIAAYQEVSLILTEQKMALMKWNAPIKLA